MMVSRDNSGHPPIDRRSGTCLIFDAVSVTRCVRNFPGNSATLSDTELYALSLDV